VGNLPIALFSHAAEGDKLTFPKSRQACCTHSRYRLPVWMTSRLEQGREKDNRRAPQQSPPKFSHLVHASKLRWNVLDDRKVI
jgi:hypothetical protein